MCYNYRVYKYEYNCAYCGDISTDDEHIVPFSFSRVIGKTKKGVRLDKRVNNLVRSCKECNSLASNFVFDSFLKKKEYILEAVTRRHRKIINSPSWTDSEIDEMEGFMKSNIVYLMLSKKRLEIRLENLRKPEIIE